jgi:hypothetical protein
MEMSALPYTHPTAPAATWLADLRLRYAALAAQPEAMVDRRSLACLAVKLAELTALVRQDTIPERDAALLPRLAHCVSSGFDVLEGRRLPAPLTYPAPPEPAQGRGAALLQAVSTYRALFGTLPTPLGRRRMEIVLARFPTADVLAALRYCAQRHGRVHWPAMEVALENKRLSQHAWPPNRDNSSA